MNRGVLYALSCYIAWGFLPIYWKALSSLPGLETTAHRIIWSALVAGILLTVQRNWHWLSNVLRQPRILLTTLATAALILANWLIYIYAINNNQLVESSLGYFINPLVNVLLGVFFLRERPRPWQWIAIAVATVGVIYLTYDYGRLPWIALGLATSFAFYALFKKIATLPSLEGLFLETVYLAVPLGIYLITLEVRGRGNLWTHGLADHVSTAYGGHRHRIAFVALQRRRAPCTDDLVRHPAIYISHHRIHHRHRAIPRTFSQSQLVGFSFIWIALALFTVEGTAEHRRLQLALRVR